MPSTGSIGSGRIESLWSSLCSRYINLSIVIASLKEEPHGRMAGCELDLGGIAVDI